ncbi:MAG: hydantoinase B/oxoprolinase family protein, partial [Leptospiraceae bacterium]|nr:hydantoinase B/oxoprolinase family protein [Leptospiraceae bacterium]
MAAILGEHRYPVRNIEQNINDLNAQVAANERGKQLLLQLVAKESAPVVRAYMRFIRENAAASVRRAIRKLKSGNARTELDNGLVIQIEIRLNPDTGSARFDFTGSSAIHAGNFNTPRSVVQAAILYVLRTLVDEEIPLNSGCLEPVEIHI